MKPMRTTDFLFSRKNPTQENEIKNYKHQQGREAVAAQLLQQATVLEQKDGRWCTALDLARFRGHKVG